MKFNFEVGQNVPIHTQMYPPIQSLNDTHTQTNTQTHRHTDTHTQHTHTHTHTHTHSSFGKIGIIFH